MLNYEQKGDKITITGIRDFNIEQTLECGQCFRFIKNDEQNYSIIAFGRVLNIIQTNDILEFFPTNVSDFENIWINYFDLDRDYDEIKERLCQNDPVMQEAVKFADGIRILNQEPFECLISFIISQNKHISGIKQIINKLSTDYGEKIGECYAFPDMERLRTCEIEDFTRIKAGFRAKYIYDAIDKISSGTIKMDDLHTLETDKLKNELMAIKGVGSKVADCTMLFSFGRHEVFPVDVWVKRGMSEMYFGGADVPIKDIHEFAKDKFGSFAGFAQQYLFHYARVKKIGSKIA